MKGTRKHERLYSLISPIIIFLSISAVVTVALLIYGVLEKSMGDNLGAIALIMLLVIVFLAALCTIGDLIRRKITVHEPTERILEATEKIASGDFNIHLEPNHAYGRYDNYDLIIENINMMATELSKSEVLKTDFISNVSHEIKTPLAIIQSYVTLMGDKNLDEKTKNEYIETVVLATKRLTNLITNILKLNKLENNKIKLEITDINLEKMLEESILTFEALVEKKSLELDIDFEPTSIKSSYSSLEIIWNNLISNAIKFTDDGGKISVQLRPSENGAVVKISDTGCGISKETGEHIFDKFYQGDTSHSGEGNGLGLALVKKVIDVLGGEISVSSEIGKGTTFIVKLVEAN